MDAVEKDTEKLIQEAHGILSEVCEIPASSSETDELTSQIFDLANDKELIEFTRSNVHMDISEYLHDFDCYRRQREHDEINRFLNYSPNVFHFANEILEGRDAVSGIRGCLENYSEQLSTVIDHMENLRSQSEHLYLLIENRKSAQQTLCGLIDTLMIKNELIDSIVFMKPEQDVFVECVHELHHKQQSVSKIKKLSGTNEDNSKAVNESIKSLGNLQAVVLKKSIAYFNDLICQLRKPMTNIDVIHQAMLRAYFLFEYVCLHATVKVDNLFFKKKT
ncbi:hypothetical protein ACOME3_001828 [Neoechinorhynchus agilis]